MDNKVGVEIEYKKVCVVCGENLFFNMCDLDCSLNESHGVEHVGRVRWKTRVVDRSPWVDSPGPLGKG